jgi:glutamyl-Q tRNA(Asp) synthetase
MMAGRTWRLTHVVRGDDPITSTARQICLQRLLALPSPRYLHVPTVRADDGQEEALEEAERCAAARRDLGRCERWSER